MGDLIPDDLLSMLLRLLIASVLSTAIGWDRERRGQPAGLRTHILVCVGAALLTMISESYAHPGGNLPPSDPSRISAQIVSGIGFLGAGTILVHGRRIRGLTTAASLWLTAAIGMAVGRGNSFYIVATVATLLVLFVLTAVDWLEERFIGPKRWRELTVTYALGAGSDHEITSLLDDLGVEVDRINRLDSAGSTVHQTEFSIRLPRKYPAEKVNARLLQFAWIRAVEWDKSREI